MLVEPSNAYRYLSFEATYTTPDTAMAGVDTMLAPVAYDHSNAPAADTAYRDLSEATYTTPPPAMTGEDTSAPPVEKDQRGATTVPAGPGYADLPVCRLSRPNWPHT